MSDSGGSCSTGCVHSDNGKCRECGHIADLRCGVCGAPITASEYDRGERCEDCCAPVFRESYLAGRRELIDQDKWAQ